MNIIKKRSRLLSLAITFILTLSLLSGTCFAQSASAAEQRDLSRIINVTGTAEVMVTPDEAVFSLAVESTNMSITKAKAENDAAIKNIKTITQDFKIDPKYVVTDFINVSPKYTYTNNGESVFKGYTIYRGMVITLKDISKFEDLLTKLLEAGANYIQNVQFKTTQLQKYKNEARTLAIRAAKEKAVALAKELGQTVGKASMIQEMQEDTYYYYNQWGTNQKSYSNVMANSTANMGQGFENNDFSPGQIKISARVSVTFDLN